MGNCIFGKEEEGVDVGCEGVEPLIPCTLVNMVFFEKGVEILTR